MRHDARPEVIAGLAVKMRSDIAQEAAGAVLVADDAFKQAGLPNPISERTRYEAQWMAENRYAYRTKPHTVRFPLGASRYYGTAAVQTMYDSHRSSMRLAADQVESMLRALRWLDRVRRGRFIGGRRLEPLRFMKKGRVVAQGRNLAALTRYLRKAIGATLIALQRVGHAREHAGILHVYFADDATLSTNFGSYDVMKDYVRRKRWLKDTPVVEIRSPEAERDPSTHPSRVLMWLALLPLVPP